MIGVRAVRNAYVGYQRLLSGRPGMPPRRHAGEHIADFDAWLNGVCAAAWEEGATAKPGTRNPYVSGRA